MLKSTAAFQAHDQAHFFQMKKFFTFFATILDNSHNAITQVKIKFFKNK